ncbi:MAG: nucleotidyltransferase family protein [Acidimicrobiia bacterium]|nr:nucleotidyltransferase family protein [Acidimicrobiia bacterium]
MTAPAPEGRGVAAAILAAGLGARLGGDRPKPLAPLGGRPLVAWALDAALASGLEPVLLVVGHRADDVAAAAPPGVAVVRAPGYEEGIAHSLAAALDELGPRRSVGAVAVGLADQPLVGPGAYRRLAAAYDEGAGLAVATHGGVRGNPVLIGREWWAEARRLSGDEGGRVLLRRHPVREVRCDGTGEPADVDTLADLQALEERCASRTDSG